VGEREEKGNNLPYNQTSPKLFLSLLRDDAFLMTLDGKVLIIKE